MLKSYRHLLRTTQQLFAGDVEALSKSHKRVKESFLANGSLLDPVDITKQIKIANETSDFLRECVVQGRLEGWKAESLTYKLKFTELS